MKNMKGFLAMIRFIKKTLIMDDDICLICMDKLGRYRGYNICSDCEYKLRFIKGARAITKDIICKFPLHYTGETKRLIYNYKYNSDTFLYKIFGQIMVNFLEEYEFKNFDYLLYIPSTKKSIRKRGFDHCKEICKYISENYNIKLLENSLIKTRETKAQHNLSMEERSINLENSFEIKDENTIKDKKILLFDDIVTSGNTLYQAVNVLKKGGAKKVDAIAIASLAVDKNIY